MSDKITFKQLVELIATQSKQSESSANSFIHELVQIIESGLKDSGSVSISGFGKFELRWMKERAGVNPQTGDEITIPGQNKVVFKPYKALRETVNKPFANLEPEILSEKSESEESSKEEEDSEDPFGLDDILGAGSPEDTENDDDSTDPFDSDTDADYDPDDPFGIDKKARESSISQDYNQYIDDLIYEKENPHFGKSEPQTASSDSNKYAYSTEEEDDVLVLEDEDDEKRPKVAPPIPDESKMAQKVQESGSYKWSYAAAVIIVMVALILLFWMMQRSGEELEETASTTPNQEQTEQVLDPSTSTTESEAETANEAAENQESSTAETQTTVSDPTVEEESPPPGAINRQADLETQSFTVESGQSLWEIAESKLGNPYLWPVIYQLNQNVLNNPNEIVASSDIEIPAFSDPDNLSEFEREQVALGYFSLYQWNRENNPDEARYFLWAVGVFSQNLLDQPPSEVDSEDLAFARNR